MFKFRKPFSTGRRNGFDDSVSNFFQDGTVGSIVGSLFERDMKNTLTSCNYQPFLYESMPEQQLLSYTTKKSSVQLQKSQVYGEIDTIVSGDVDAYTLLLECCPLHSIPHNFKVPTGKHVALFEAKSSVSRLIADCLDKQSKSGNENLWWLTNPPFLDNIVKIVILNGGKQSEDFFDPLKRNSIPKADAIWKFLEEAGVALLCLSSFSVEWVRDLTAENKKILDENKKILDENKKIRDALIALGTSPDVL